MFIVQIFRFFRGWRSSCGRYRGCLPCLQIGCGGTSCGWGGSTTQVYAKLASSKSIYASRIAAADESTLRRYGPEFPDTAIWIWSNRQNGSWWNRSGSKQNRWNPRIGLPHTDEKEYVEFVLKTPVNKYTFGGVELKLTYGHSHVRESLPDSLLVF